MWCAGIGASAIVALGPSDRLRRPRASILLGRGVPVGRRLRRVVCEAFVAPTLMSSNLFEKSELKNKNPNLSIRVFDFLKLAFPRG